MECSGRSPEAQSVDSKDDELAEAKANARSVAGLLDGLGGLHQLLLVQLADLGLQGEGCHSADAGHCLRCCLVGLVKQLASLIIHLHNLEANTTMRLPQKAGASKAMYEALQHKQVGSVTQAALFPSLCTEAHKN